MNKVSIVTVTYNCGCSFIKTAHSIIDQTYKNYEFLVIDGGSNEETLKEIANFEKYIDYFVSEPDDGIYDAMNKAIRAATGDWIIFMNAGDVFYDKSTLRKCFERDLEGYAAVYGSWYSKKKKGLIYRPCDVPFWNSKKKFKGMGFSHQSVFVRVNWARKFYFDTSFKCCADYNMIYNIYMNGGAFYCVNIPIAIFDGRDGFSIKNRKLQIKEHAKILGIEKTLYFRIFYIKEIFKLKIKQLIGRE